MHIHGVDENEYINTSNMKSLHEYVLSADKIISY